MGYHFLLRTFEYPKEAECGDCLRCRLLGENRGVAPIYHAIPLRVALRNENATHLFTTNVDIRRWLPGKIKAAFDLPLPAGIEAGEYDLAITLSGEGTPVIRWENEGIKEDGFLRVGRVVIRKKSDPAAEKHEAYLSDFLREFGYPNETKDALAAAFRSVFSDKKSRKTFEKLRLKYEKDPNMRFSRLRLLCDEIAERCDLSAYTVYLLVLILLSESSKKIYAARGLSEEMWRENMRDLKYTSDLCPLMKGTQGTYCPEWYAGFFAARRVTFGRLQFEQGRLGKEYQKGDLRLSPDDAVIYIHIPRSGEKLLPDAVDDACRKASAFFKERYQTKRIVFACHSWLLYPENMRILPEKSNLASFISRFDIIDVKEDTEYHDVWRLFDVEYAGDPSALPQDTSLRRAYAERIKDRLPLGVGLGVWIYGK